MKSKSDFIRLFPSDYVEFEKALREPSPVSIRLNSGKVSIDDLASRFVCTEKVPWCNSGYYLAERPAFTLDPLFHAGAYYVQEAASMFVERCFERVRSFGQLRTALDLCAAPGGKSTHLASLLCGEALLVANETIRSRLGSLRENMSKWGKPNVIVTNSDPKEFKQLGDFFDFVLVDAPCSGEGMFRKEAEALKQWSIDLVKHCAARQRRIVSEVWEALRPGGFMLYSTCTYNLLENEETASLIVNELGAETVSVDVSDCRNIESSEYQGIRGYRFFPHKTRSEGFFACLMRKSGEKTDATSRGIKRKIPKKEYDLSKWFGTKYKLMFTEIGGRIRAYPREFAGEIEILEQRLRTVSSGIEVAELKGQSPAPNIDAILCDDFNAAAFAELETDLETALRYLRRETIIAPAGTPQGFVVLTYGGIAFGLVKNLGSRCNNLLPPARRIQF
ncbi:MAG: rRNA cytosine-C5-methyltransferase [Prevotellaceae bacterium]|jgi:16S rRNA C967 or C1407 C5-methylase (RsmB/RsmF family)/NOL1/NOP2/fmu family ribosome biogenesis protein|nr:rRNA cytosine-C5-methyltransferase [Prevotellaceae bacterium]